jgi:hypothetical protein
MIFWVDTWVLPEPRDPNLRGGNMSGIAQIESYRKRTGKKFFDVQMGTVGEFRRIPHYVDSLFESDGLDDESGQLQKGYADSGKAEPNNPPVGVSGILFLLGLLVGFGLALAGVEKLDGQGKLIGSALISCGLFLAIVGGLILLGLFDGLLISAWRFCSYIGA